MSDGQAIIQKEFHAASRCSNSTASWISCSGTSYQRATSVTQPAALAAFAKTSVARPCRFRSFITNISHGVEVVPSSGAHDRILRSLTFAEDSRELYLGRHIHGRTDRD